MKNKYIHYNIYECPVSPNENGKFINKATELEQAVTACEKAKEQGKEYFIKGVKKDGTEVLFL